MVNTDPVVLALPDSDEHDAALTWASAEAAARAVPLHIVHTYFWPPSMIPTTHIPTLSPDAWQLEREHAEALVDSAAERARQLRPGLTVTAQAVAGRPIPVLQAKCDQAELLVIGSNRLANRTARLLGSIGQYLTSHAGCPVVAVSSEVAGQAAREGRVAIEVNLAEPAPQALRFAFVEASRHGCPVLAMGYWRPYRAAITDTIAALLLEPADLQRDLDEALAPMRAQYPQVPVQSVVFEADVVEQMVHSTSGDRMLVVATWHNGVLSRLILNSVGHSLLRNAHCPVAVVPGEKSTGSPLQVPVAAQHHAGLPRPAVVIGISGSPEQDDIAVHWAAREAMRRSVPLRVVSAYHWVRTLSRAAEYVSDPELGLAEIRSAAERAATAVTATLAGQYPQLQVSTSVVEADPVPALLAESASAELLVLGSRRLGALGSFVMGSVGAELACRAQCPVVVVRGPESLPGEPGRVVAGVDGSLDSEAVLRFAFEAASLSRSALTVVLAWRAGFAASLPWRQAGIEAIAEHARLAMAETLAGWQEKYPDVAVHAKLVQGEPAAMLLAECEGQQLLVVGDRASSPARASMLGSVTQNVLHHANCPVAVIAGHPRA